MSPVDTFKYLVGAYYGIVEMDEYDTKVYILKEIEQYIRDFLYTTKIEDIDLREYALEIEKEMPLKTKLQDSLLVLPKINAPMELVLLVKKRIKKIQEEDYQNSLHLF